VLIRASSVQSVAITFELPTPLLPCPQGRCRQAEGYAWSINPGIFLIQILYAFS